MFQFLIRYYKSVVVPAAAAVVPGFNSSLGIINNGEVTGIWDLNGFQFLIRYYKSSQPHIPPRFCLVSIPH